MKKKKTAIIFGVSGQDGSYLSHFLYNKGYKVIGVTRNKSLKNLYRLKILDILKKINVIQGEASNLKFCKKILSSRIDEIYFLAGQSSVTESFENPHISLNSNVVGLLNILKTIKDKRYKIRLFNAGSAQFYGDNKNYKYNLDSQIDPQSPYGISKAAAYWLVKMYREKYNILCCTGILFNHESCLRSEEFVTKKIINISKKIKNNKKIKLRLGNINIYRDWGWAPEYVEAFWLMLQQKKTQDLILGTGKIHSLKEFVYEVFRLLKIDKKNLKHNIKKFNRKLDIRGYRADINQAKNKINWKAKTNFKKIIFKMVNDELF